MLDTGFVSEGIDKEGLAVFSDGAGGTMAEASRSLCSRGHCQVATKFCHPTSSRFSKPISSTQPPLLAVLCLMRYEDWTFREAEVRLPRAPRVACRIAIAGGARLHTLYRFLRRLGMTPSIAIAGNRASAAATPMPPLLRHRRQRGSPTLRQHLLPSGASSSMPTDQASSSFG